jgi:3'-phosphoadenosine 5'-phosphosulfate sulfotransferase (PAPS reductase)/FAD synthetase
MYLISTSFGNDSIALIQLAHELGLEDCYVVYIDTGWSHPDWENRVMLGRALAESYGFITWTAKGFFDFESMVLMKKGFPSNQFQFCSGILKGIPFGDFADFIDPERKATVVIGKRREESEERKDTPEYIENSEYHDGRKLWHPLYKHTETERNKLIKRAGFKVLPHRSMECCPCVNANRNDLVYTPESRLDRVRYLESEIGKTMFRDYRHQGAIGINEVMEWACSGGHYSKNQVRMFDNYKCKSGLCDQ